jgi:large subunit ribosomal protein L49
MFTRSSILTLPTKGLLYCRARKVISRQKLKQRAAMYGLENKDIELKPREPLKYPLKELPESTKPSGWLEPLGGTEHLPFQIKRTANKQLPVYSDIRNGRTRYLTIVRKFSGDVKELKEELERLLGLPVTEKVGKLVIPGKHVATVKNWLKQLGF